MSLAFLFTVTILCLLNVSFALIPSDGTTTAAAARSGFNDNDFRITIDNGAAVETPEFSARIADLSRFPVLAGVDVQSTIVRVTIRAQMSFFRHYHPRGTETLNLLSGRLRTSFTFEGTASPRVVTVTLRGGESTVFPEALPHELTCVSNHDCTYISILNSADAGTVRI